MTFRALSAVILFVVLCWENSTQAAPPNGEQVKLLPPSTTAQRLYESGRNDLLQLRILLRNGRAQSSVGSGFLIGTGNLVVTNYHVVSQLALEPETYAGEYVDTSGRRGGMELMAVDVNHDLAVVRVDRRGSGFFRIPDPVPELRQGQYLYSLGNPLDLGFAISEGAYNGVIRRGFYDQLMFTGPINAGMSGGPSISADGMVAGVNVSKRLDGELVSFLVPIRHARELLNMVAAQSKPPKSFNESISRQLLGHQSVMVNHLLATPLTMKSLGHYLVPVRESDQVRCWGQSNNKPDLPYSVEQIKCSMESAIYVASDMQTGRIAIQHEYARATRLDPLRFSRLVAKSFKNERFGSHKDRRRTRPVCGEEFVTNGKLPMRAVVCVRAYRKFTGLYDFSVLADSSDDNLLNLQSRLDIKGVSYENGLRVSRVFLDSIGRKKKP